MEWFANALRVLGQHPRLWETVATITTLDANLSCHNIKIGLDMIQLGFLFSKACIFVEFKSTKLAISLIPAKGKFLVFNS